MALGITIPALIANQAVKAYHENEYSARTPSPMSSGDAAEALYDAAINRARQIAPKSDELIVGLNPYVPKPDEKVDLGKAASVSRAKLKNGKDASMISINPNIDRSYLAHEFGHAVSQKTKIGDFINKARHGLAKNPKLAKALAIALPSAAAVTGAALQEGDDDLLGSIGLAAAMASPKLVDEALASKNALAIMKDAGMPATMGQRGRLAGAYLSYLAPVLIAGSVGNAVGNYADDYTALYNL